MVICEWFETCLDSCYSNGWCFFNCLFIPLFWEDYFIRYPFWLINLIVTLIILGGLVMTAISLIIPPLLHYSCYKKTLSWFSIFMHFFVGIFSTVFMGISTFYSVKALIEQMYHYFLITNNPINLLLNTSHLLIYY